MPFPEWLRAAGTVVGMSALTVLELKASIPVGLAMGLPLWETFLIAVIGSTIPVPFILLLLRPFFRWCKGRPFFHGIAEKLEGRFRKKASGVRKYSLLGLFLFVAVPLPGTGVWTGSGIAAMLDIRIAHALPVIVLGNCVAGLLMLLLGQIVIL